MMASESEVQWIDQAEFSPLVARAAASARRRTNYNFHAGPADPVQRMLNVLMADSYCPPHRHFRLPKSETLLALQGCVGVLIFSGTGEIRSARRLGGPGNPAGTDIPAGYWHTVVALSPHAVMMEIKPGPYDPSADREFAGWAPGEGDAGAPDYLKTLKQAFA